MASTAGLDIYTAKKDHANIREQRKAAGYNAEKIVLMVATRT